MVTEIRDYGNGRTIVLYTNENAVFQRFRDSAKCLRVIPYEQDQKKKVALVGVDLYFNKKYRNWLEKRIGVVGVQVPAIS